MRNPKYRADNELTPKQDRARRKYRRAMSNLGAICDLARCPITEDATFLKARLAKRVDAIMAALADAEQLDPDLHDRMTISTMNVPT